MQLPCCRSRQLGLCGGPKFRMPFDDKLAWTELRVSEGPSCGSWTCSGIMLAICTAWLTFSELVSFSGFVKRETKQQSPVGSRQGQEILVRPIRGRKREEEFQRKMQSIMDKTKTRESGTPGPRFVAGPVRLLRRGSNMLQVSGTGQKGLEGSKGRA